MNTDIKQFTETQIKILNKSSELFGDFGYDGVSVRQIAKEASVNLAAIGYHFGGKQELYKACIQLQIGRIFNKLRPIMIKVDKALQIEDNISKKEWENLLDEFIETITTFFASEDHKPKFMLFLRERLKPTKESDFFREELFVPVRKYLSILINKNFKLDLDNEIMHFILFTVIGQLFALIILKAEILKQLNTQTITNDFVIKLKNNIISSIRLMALHK